MKKRRAVHWEDIVCIPKYQSKYSRKKLCKLRGWQVIVHKELLGKKRGNELARVVLPGVGNTVIFLE